jgi:hypothetical protein
MSNETKKKFRHLETIEGYQKIWRSALHSKPQDSDNATLRFARNQKNFSRIEALIRKFVEKHYVEHHFILSLGCGGAYDLNAVKQFFLSGVLVGIDTSRVILTKAKRNLSFCDTSLVCASMSDLPFKRSLKFDMIISGQTIDLDFEEDYLERLLEEITTHSSSNCRFYMTFFGTNEEELVLHKCTPIGNKLEKLGWRISYAEEYHFDQFEFAQGVFWVAERSSLQKSTDA